MTSRYDTYRQPYGDLTKLNRVKRILNAVGKTQLEEIVGDYLDSLNTSAAIYEADGSYAVGIFTSGWCRMMYSQSRVLCDTEDDIKALDSGEWHCHESCWAASKESMKEDLPIKATTDGKIRCLGGIRIYAVPIHAFKEVIGAINFGYGSPPSNENALVQLSDRYKIPLMKLKAVRDKNNVAGDREVKLAKGRLRTASNLIGALVERFETKKPDLNLDRLQRLITRFGE